MKQVILYFNLLILFVMSACREKTLVDLIVTNAKVYSVDSSMTVYEAFAVKGGKFLKLGTTAEILAEFQSENILDISGSYVYPGFQDAHCHFLGYGINLISRADLNGTKNTDEIIDRLLKFREQNKNTWLEGRGWDQNDWPDKNFPTKELLDKFFPDVPVYLIRVDGHAAWVNSLALQKTGVTAQTRVDGGEIILKDGQPTGILLDNAMDLVRNIIPEPTDEMKEKALLMAQHNCFEVGLTSVTDAGLKAHDVMLIDSLQKAGKLKIHINVMLEANEECMDFIRKHGKYKTDLLNICAVKVYADGALGSRGAELKKPYADDAENTGILTISPDSFRNICKTAYDNRYQVCTHAIGDSAVNYVLNTYSEFLKTKNDRRWRVEHSQIIDPVDIGLFAEYSIVPSVQPTHATSDMYWAKSRLGKERMKGAYAYQDLLKQNGWLPVGSDFPIEDINPLFGFYAGICRKDHTGFPEGGFQMENALTREQALRGMTVWASRASFMENESGSIEPGKYADFVILEKDIMTIPENEIITGIIEKTVVGGQQVYSKVLQK